MRLCVNALCGIPRGHHVNNLRQKAPQNRGVFVPPVAATDSLSTNDIAVSNKERVEATVEQENLPRRNYLYSSISRAKDTNDRANIGKYAAQHGPTGLCTLMIILVMPLILSLMVFVRLVLLVPGTIDYL